ncbi:hypothetical protein [Streptomyces coeruleorubidus]|uniref:hypothetical protein n=1 Tax=Streptomyces coeruleorubidus TaxID=116188 RepID=UPI0033A8CDE6
MAVHDAVDDGTAYRAELSARVDSRSCPTVLQHDLQLPYSWWEDLTGTLESVAAVDTDRVAVRQQHMDRAIPESRASQPPRLTCWKPPTQTFTGLTSPRRWPFGLGGWGQAAEGLDTAALYAYSLLQEDVAGPCPRRLPRAWAARWPRR